MPRSKDVTICKDERKTAEIIDKKLLEFEILEMNATLDHMKKKFRISMRNRTTNQQVINAEMFKTT